MGIKERERRVEVFFYGLFMDEELLRSDVDSLIRRGTKTRAGHLPPRNGLANSRFHTLLFGINRLRSDELPHCWANSHCSGAFVQLLCNRYFALNTQKMITITKALRPACSTRFLRKARFSSK